MDTAGTTLKTKVARLGETKNCQKQKPKVFVTQSSKTFSLPTVEGCVCVCMFQLIGRFEGAVSKLYILFWWNFSDIFNLHKTP